MSETREDIEPAQAEATGSRRGTARPSAADGLSLARDHLLSLQSPAGWWKGELETNVTMDAEDMLLREFLSIRSDEVSARQAAWIRSQQRADGTWANFAGGPADLSTTIEAYVALKLAGDDPGAEHMRLAAAFVRGAGGLQQARVFTRIWMALFGAWSWNDVPALLPEQILLPPWFPLNVYDFACWARQTVVALSVVLALRPVRPLPFSISELDGAEPFSAPRGETPLAKAIIALDAVLQRYQRFPIAPLRRLSLRRAERWIVDRQEDDGGWGGIQPPWVYSLIALNLLGYELDHPVMRRGIAGLETFTIEQDGIRRLEACQSPVWDTCLSMIALTDAGLPGDDPAIVRAADWLLDEQILARGDWAVRRPELAPGGWAFEFANANYPDVDDTAEVIIALNAVRHPEPARVRTAIERGVVWLQGMQSSDGGWAAFDVDNTRALVRDLPFCDFGEVIDPPSADVTAHVVEMFALLGRAEEPAPQRGVRWLLAHQEPGGSWFGRWGANHVYGTGAVVPALIAAGVPREDPAIRRAVAFLERVQNEDGGWGEDMRSYDDDAWIGRGASTASQTAWALLALHAAGERSPAVRGGMRWLAETQREDGGWDEPFHTGTGFPGDFYINYHLYRQIFPVMALGRCVSAGVGDGARFEPRRRRAA
ncbi:MAG TPA: squalene--hopene cyclase [Solirubrobacteraceae bacterium]|nr:squalene--hopene cyclase [Solirubrobacteraceae bacterium]